MSVKVKVLDSGYMSRTYNRDDLFETNSSSSFEDKAIHSPEDKSCSKGDSTPMVYAPLNDAIPEIRLLNFAMNQKGELEGHLWPARLDNNELEYDALSYVWGKPTKSMHIVIDGRKLQITKNLYRALSLLAGSVTKPLWVDAICINQENTKERNHQVSLMRKVYSRAETVHIHLGHGSHLTSSAFAAMEVFVHDASIQSWSTSSRLSAAGLIDILKSPWWQRLWVFQEATLAKNPLLHLGDRRIAFWTLIGGLRIVRNAALNDQFPASHLGGWADVLDAVVYSYSVARLNDNPPDTLLTVASSFKVSDGRDRIYGLLGLMPSLLELAPDYSLSALQVYVKASTIIMKNLQSLRLLRLIKSVIPVDRCARPSWIPTFDHPGGLIGLHDVGFGSSNKFDIQNFHLESTPTLELYVKAIVPDSIQSVCDVVKTEDKADQVQSLKHLLECWMTWALEHNVAHTGRSYGHTLDHDMRTGLQQFRHTFWSTVLCDGVFRIVSQREDYDLEDMIATYDTWLQDRTGQCKLSSYLYRQLSLLTCESSFFISKKGRFGVSRSSIRQGDKVALLGGEVIPYILKLAETGEGYHLIGSCFCNGLMYGEGIDEAIAAREADGLPFDVGDLYSKVKLC